MGYSCDQVAPSKADNWCKPDPCGPSSYQQSGYCDSSSKETNDFSKLMEEQPEYVQLENKPISMVAITAGPSDSAPQPVSGKLPPFVLQVSGQNGYSEPYYLNPDQGQLRFPPILNEQQLTDKYGDRLSADEARGLVNSMQHKPQDKQQAMVNAIDSMIARGERITPQGLYNELSKPDSGYNEQNPDFVYKEITYWGKAIDFGNIYA